MSRGRTRHLWFWTIQSLTFARVALVFGFIVLVPFHEWWPYTLAMYLAALLTDVFYGQLARAKKLATRFGGALDVFGDRYFSVISCLYVGFRGVSLVPLALILLRELYSVALRMVQINGKGVMLQSRRLGSIVHSLIAIGTSGFIASPENMPSGWFVVPFYVIAAFYAFYLPFSIWKSRARIRVSIKTDLDRAF
jgi:phosphatidylglycerophosphate synthase